ncbi:MAG: 1-phosphofructokinase family hexose kinase [Lachnospiraceae bacterium]|nr:1-phosphofructokinase family hexose kinase [Lachnospiraceae bacterium]
MIHTLTLNPAIDRILYLPQLTQNITNRIRSTRDTIGGKGTHVSIDLSQLGQRSTAFGICHGPNGQNVIDILSEYDIDVCFNHYDAPGKNTRTNYLVIEDTTDCTILAEPGVKLTEKEICDLIDRMKHIIKEGDYLLFSGDASNSPDPAVYNRIMRELKDKNIRFVLDASGASLKSCICESPYMIKPNLDELSMLVDYPVGEDIPSILKAMDSLAQYNVEIIAVSLGGDGSVVRTPEGTFRVEPPKVNVCNTIGCGDCFLAGFVYGLASGLNTEETLRIATASSAAAAESTLSIGFDEARKNELLSQVKITRI